MRKKLLSIAGFIIILAVNISFGQVNGKNDSLNNILHSKNNSIKKYKHFVVFDFGPSFTRVNTNFTSFKTSLNKYEFEKNHYNVNYDWSFMFGWVFKDKSYLPWDILKIGYGMSSRSANVKDSSGNKLKFQESFFKIPLFIGMRLPLNKSKNGSYSSLDANVGVQAFIPYYEKLDYVDNLDSKVKDSFCKYIRYGLSAEIAYSFLKENGRTNSFGIRYTLDSDHFTKIKNTNYELYPIYHSYTVFFSFGLYGT